MKKIIFVIFLLFFFPISVEAVEYDLSLKRVKNDLIKSDIYNKFKNEGASCEITYTNTSFDVTCKLKNEGTYKTNLTMNKGVLSYKFDGNRNGSNTYENIVFDSLWLTQIADCIAEYYGLDLGKHYIARIYHLYTNKYTLANNGIEYTFFNFNVNGETGQGFDTFKVYVNDGTIKEEISSSNNNSNSNTSNNNTGSSTNKENTNTSKPSTDKNNSNSNKENNNSSSSNNSNNYKPPSNNTNNNNTSNNNSNNSSSSKPSDNNSVNNNTNDDNLTINNEKTPLFDKDILKLPSFGSDNSDSGNDSVDKINFIFTIIFITFFVAVGIVAIKNITKKK